MLAGLWILAIDSDEKVDLDPMSWFRAAEKPRGGTGSSGRGK